MKGSIDVDLGDVIQSLNIEVKVVGTRVAKARMWLASGLIHLGAKLINAKSVDIDFGKSD